MSTSPAAPVPTPTRPAFWWFALPALLLAVPALVYGAATAVASSGSDADFAGIGVLIGLVIGAPGALATVLALVGVAVRRRHPDAALGLAIAALAMIGLLALLAVPVFLGVG